MGQNEFLAFGKKRKIVYYKIEKALIPGF